MAGKAGATQPSPANAATPTAHDEQARESMVSSTREAPRIFGPAAARGTRAFARARNASARFLLERSLVPSTSPQLPRPVPIAVSGASGATLLFRKRDKLYVTAVLKATYALSDGAIMTPLAPSPILTEEREGLGGLVMPSDLVPFRWKVDVTVTGHAFVPARFPQTSTMGLRTRLRVEGDGAPLLDKTLDLHVINKGHTPGRARLFGLGPLSSKWPVRSRLLQGHDPRRFEGTFLDLPASFDESYFQAAPADQRIPAVRGDEWVTLDGVSQGSERIAFRLPGARGAASLHGATRTNGWVEPPRIDSISIDVDESTCDITWRGFAPIDPNDLDGPLSITAAVEMPRSSRPPRADVGRAVPAPVPVPARLPRADDLDLYGVPLLPTG